MAQSAQLLGDSPIDVETFVPQDTAAAKAMIKDEEDTELEFAKAVANAEQVSSPVNNRINNDPDYETLDKMMKAGKELYIVKNTANIPVVMDWDLVLLPEDMLKAFNEYLSGKYVQYGMERLIGKQTIIAVYQNGKTINFLHNYMTEKQIPTLVSKQEGKEFDTRSQFVIHPDETIIVTKEQLVSLAKYEKLKYVSPNVKGDKKEVIFGFLIFNPVEKGSQLREVRRSYVTYKDVMNSEAPVSIEKMTAKASRSLGGFTRVTE